MIIITIIIISIKPIIEYNNISAGFNFLLCTITENIVIKNIQYKSRHLKYSKNTQESFIPKNIKSEKSSLAQKETIKKHIGSKKIVSFFWKNSLIDMYLSKHT